MSFKQIVTIASIFILILSSTSINAQFENKIDKTSELPSYFNWQDINGTDYTTPIKNQLPSSTCEAYALCSTLETMMQFQSKEIFNADLSEAHLYYYAGGTYEANLVNLTHAADYLIDYGVPDEGCFPDPNRAYDFPYESLKGWENRTVKITNWGWVDHDINSIKSALIEYGPLVIVIKLYMDFIHYFGGVYKHRWGKEGAGHVLSLIGYDDCKKCWICKNSYGKNWGERGYFRLSYDANIFYDYYGNGTGIMYLNGTYGNFKPDVPKINIEKPDIYKTYLFGIGFPTLFQFKKFKYQLSSARIFGRMKVKTSTENTNKVEFYLDNNKTYTDYEPPFEWILNAPIGNHIIKVIAHNDHNISIDVKDIIIII